MNCKNSFRCETIALTKAGIDKLNFCRVLFGALKSIVNHVTIKYSDLINGSA